MTHTMKKVSGGYLISLTAVNVHKLEIKACLQTCKPVNCNKSYNLLQIILQALIENIQIISKFELCIC